MAILTLHISIAEMSKNAKLLYLAYFVIFADIYKDAKTCSHFDYFPLMDQTEREMIHSLELKGWEGGFIVSSPTQSLKAPELKLVKQAIKEIYKDQRMGFYFALIITTIIAIAYFIWKRAVPSDTR